MNFFVVNRVSGPTLHWAAKGVHVTSKTPKEVLQLLLQWLKLDDLRNVSLVNRTLYRNARLAQIRSFNIIWRVPASDEDRQVLKDLQPRALDDLPQSLKHLSVGDEFNQTLDNLPRGLETLDVFGAFDRPLLNLPRSLQLLKIPQDYAWPLPDGLYVERTE